MTTSAAPAPAVPGLPRDDAGSPVFREPWEAQAFALTVSLHERGCFSWPEWARALGAAIADDRGTGAERYYHHWLAALEQLVAAKGLTDAATLARHREGWDRAARRTPHGSPIDLTAADLAPVDLTAADPPPGPTRR